MHNTSSFCLYWFRNDLRLIDNPALAAAAKHGTVLPIFVYDSEAQEDWRYGAASKWWLHHSLSALSKQLESIGVRLILRHGAAEEVLPNLATEVGADHIFFSRRIEPWASDQENRALRACADGGITGTDFPGNHLYEPWEINTKSGGFYQRFTPYWQACRQAPPPPSSISAPFVNGSSDKVTSDCLDDWALLPKAPDWAKKWSDFWQPGEQGAHQALQEFVNSNLSTYKKSRDFPAHGSTSLLSPHLTFGEISVRQIWHLVKDQPGAADFLTELGWRDFGAHLLYHFKDLPTTPFSKKFRTFKWDANDDALQKWHRGQTGFPLVDAGMRELWQTGFMHNRVRMVVGSFLVKDLLIPWQEGEKWFWDTLIDADLSSNAMNWQWVAGSGADAAPYFRIFNPTRQSERFDPNGAYIRRWVPELAKLPDKYIHEPSQAPRDVLQTAGVIIGKTYPVPIVDHAAARDEALRRYKAL